MLFSFLLQELKCLLWRVCSLWHMQKPPFLWCLLTTPLVHLQHMYFPSRCEVPIFLRSLLLSFNPRRVLNNFHSGSSIQAQLCQPSFAHDPIAYRWHHNKCVLIDQIAMGFLVCSWPYPDYTEFAERQLLSCLGSQTRCCEAWRSIRLSGEPLLADDRGN